MRRRAFPYLLALLLASPLAAVAQAQQPEQATTDAPQADPAHLSLAELEELWAQTEATADPEEVESLRARYEQTRTAIENARAIEAETQEFERLSAEAAALLETIQAELSKPSVERSDELGEEPTVAEAQQAVASAQAERDAARQQVRDFEAEAARRAARTEAIPGELAQARQTLADHEAQPTVTTEDESLESVAIRTAQRSTQRRLLSAQVARLEAEAASYTSRTELLPARRDRAVRRVGELEAFVEALQVRLNDARTREAERSAEAAAQALREAAGASQAIQAIATRNAAIAEARTGPSGVAAMMEAARSTRNAEHQRLERIAQNYARVRELISAIGLTDTVGLTLRTFRSDLPDVRELNRQIRGRRDEIRRAIFELYDLERDRRELADIDAAVLRATDIYQGENPGASADEIEAVASAARRLLMDRVALLNESIRDYRSYRGLLHDLDATQLQLRSATIAVDAFINQRVLWISSAPPIGPADAGEALERLNWAFHPGVIGDGMQHAAADALDRPYRPVIVFGVLLLLFALSRQAGRLSASMARRRVHMLHNSIIALLEPALVAAIGLALFSGIAWLLDGAAAMDGAPSLQMTNIAESLRDTSILLFLLLVVHAICRDDGYAVNFLGWRQSVVVVVRRTLSWYTPIAAVLGIIALSSPIEVRDFGADAPDPTALRRLAGVSLAMLTSLALWRMLRGDGPIISQMRQANQGGWVSRTRVFWVAILVGAPITLGVMSLLGYVYTSVAIGPHVIWSYWAIVGAIIIQSALNRWLVVTRRELEIDQARRRREAAAAEDETGVRGADTDPESEVPGVGDDVDLGAMQTQTGRLFRSAVTIGLVLTLWTTWVGTAPALQMLDRIELYPEFGDFVTVSDIDPVALNAMLEMDRIEASVEAQQADEAGGADSAAETAGANDAGSTTMAGLPSPSTIGMVAPTGVGTTARDEDLGTLSLAEALFAIIVGFVAIAASRNVPGLIEIALLKHIEMDRGLRNAITALVRYVIGIAGMLIAFSIAGLSWSSVQWLAAALTFGLAFGLQEIFANFVSGLIILFERPIRIGDTVTVGDVSGEVTQIKFRATTVTDWDRKELVVPNKEFITQKLINWTLSDPTMRIVIPIGVEYGSDVNAVSAALLRAAHRSRDILRTPGPRALFLRFGDCAMEFELRVYIPSTEFLLSVKDELHRSITAELRDAGVEIAFPQRDLHLRSISDDARSALRGEPRSDGGASPEGA